MRHIGPLVLLLLGLLACLPVFSKACAKDVQSVKICCDRSSPPSQQHHTAFNVESLSPGRAKSAKSSADRAAAAAD